MAEEKYLEIWSRYQDAWANISAEEREKLLCRAVVEDCTFSSPQAEGHGRQQLITHIEEFQKQYPGASFKTHKLIVHHGQLLAEWMMYDGNGAEFLPGTSYARIGTAGQLIALTGFWEIP